MSLRNISIQTDRLLIREMRLDDAEQMYKMESDPDTHTYLGNKPYTSAEQCRQYILQTQQQYMEDGVSRWAITLKSTGDFIGRTGFKLMRNRINGYVNYYDFGFRIMKKYWKQGYGYESAMGVLEYSLDELHRKNVHAMTDVANTGARHILQKTGFKFIEEFEYDGPPPWHKGQLVAWYSLKKT